MIIFKYYNKNNYMNNINILIFVILIKNKNNIHNMNVYKDFKLEKCILLYNLFQIL